MNPYFRLKVLTDYPEWHRKPLRLTTAEIENPWLVVEEFFGMYHLTDIRENLKLWLDDTVESGSEDMMRHVHTSAMVEKLAEAAYLLLDKKEEEESLADDHISETEDRESGLTEDQNDDADVTQESKQKLFAKRLIIKAVGNDPRKAIISVFKMEEPDTLKETIQQWCKTALSNERANYEEPSQREDLLSFCNELPRLVEAACCIGRICQIEERTGFPLNRPTGLQPDILRKEQAFSLSYEELLDPVQVLHEFCEQFSGNYVKAELWDMLDSAINSGNKSLQFYALLHYQCLLTLTEAARRLHRQKRSAFGPAS
jgi:hypothetical protein